MNNIVPIGSIVEVNTSKYCILGYGSINKEGKELAGYYGAVAPIGFINLEKLVFIPYSHVTKVLFTGYSTDSSNMAIKMIENKDGISKKYSSKEILEAKARISEIIEKKKER